MLKANKINPFLRTYAKLNPVDPIFSAIFMESLKLLKVEWFGNVNIPKQVSAVGRGPLSMSILAFTGFPPAGSCFSPNQNISNVLMVISPVHKKKRLIKRTGKDYTAYSTYILIYMTLPIR